MATATAPAPNSTQSTAKKPLWPRDRNLEVIGLTGDFESGKTMFGLTICPGKETLVYDTEKSAGTYQSLGFDRIDVPAEMTTKHPNGFKPIDLFMFWRDHIKPIPVGKYRVIMLDTVSEIESGLAEYVRQNPRDFGYSPGQFAKAEGLMWGAVKDYWKSILSDIAARCETFVFTSHLRRVWKGNSPTSERAPKGKETLMELASLYLFLERKIDAKGNKPRQPSATVLKSRLADTTFDPETGDVESFPLLPPRLPIATPKAIREYILNPPDYSKLKSSERVEVVEESESEKEERRLAIAEAERDTEALKLERMKAMGSQKAQKDQKEQQAKRTASVKVGKSATVDTNATTKTPDTSVADGDGSDQAHPFGDAATVEQLQRILWLKNTLNIQDATWKDILSKRGVTTAVALGADQVAELISKLEVKLKAKYGGAKPGN